MFRIPSRSALTKECRHTWSFRTFNIYDVVLLLENWRRVLTLVKTLSEHRNTSWQCLLSSIGNIMQYLFTGLVSLWHLGILSKASLVLSSMVVVTWTSCNEHLWHFYQLSVFDNLCTRSALWSFEHPALNLTQLSLLRDSATIYTEYPAPTSSFLILRIHPISWAMKTWR